MPITRHTLRKLFAISALLLASGTLLADATAIDNSQTMRVEHDLLGE
jgi:hypothetical protein